MALRENRQTYTYKSAGVIGENRFVKMHTAARTAALCGNGELPIGVTENESIDLGDGDAGAGQPLTVGNGGILRVEAGATVNPGQFVASGANGVADVAATGEMAIGVCVSGGAAGTILEVQWLGPWIAA